MNPQGRPDKQRETNVVCPACGDKLQKKYLVHHQRSQCAASKSSQEQRQRLAEIKQRRQQKETQKQIEREYAERENIPLSRAVYILSFALEHRLNPEQAKYCIAREERMVEERKKQVAAESSERRRQTINVKRNTEAKASKAANLRTEAINKQHAAEKEANAREKAKRLIEKEQQYEEAVKNAAIIKAETTQEEPVPTRKQWENEQRLNAELKEVLDDLYHASQSGAKENRTHRRTP